MSSNLLLEIVDLIKTFGAILVTNRVSLNVKPGELHALIGPNGAGKSTLINQITGELDANEGTIWFDGQMVNAMSISNRAKMGISRAYQVPQLFSSMTVSAHLNMAQIAKNHLGFQMWNPSVIHESLSESLEMILSKVGLLHLANHPSSELAHGEKRQLEMAICLSSSPKLLILDEPLAGLGPSESAQMIELIRSLKGAYGILLVEHDMEAVFSLADRVSVLVNGEIISSGSVEFIQNDELVKAAYLGDELEAH
jgi:branched-chain amino acid transport system ATP-binding protein